MNTCTCTAHLSQAVKASKQLVESRHQSLGRNFCGKVSKSFDVGKKNAEGEEVGERKERKGSERGVEGEWKEIGGKEEPKRKNNVPDIFSTIDVQLTEVGFLLCLLQPYVLLDSLRHIHRENGEKKLLLSNE
jgi:hypothetical protein